MQIIKKLVVGLLAVAMLLSTFTMLNTKSVCAKSKKVYYSGSFLGKVKDVDNTLLLRWLTLSKKEIVKNQFGVKKRNIVKEKNELLNWLKMWNFMKQEV